MAKIFTPTNQMRLTNVAVVRIKKAGKRFEIACYKNKVIAWRQQLEKDIDEVLQTHTVFLNVSKGQVARREELLRAFDTDDATAVCRLILEKGELQVSEKERQAQLQNSVRDIATLVADMCVNPETKRPYPVTMIEKAMKSVHYSVKPHRSSKQQALEVARLLPAAIPIERAQMRVCVTFAAQGQRALRRRVHELSASVESDVVEPVSGEVSVVCLLDPGHYRQLDEMVRAETKGAGRVELISLKHVVESASLDS